MAKLATCKKCNKQLQPEERYSHASKTYCKQCYDQIIKDGNEYRQLMDFICINYNIERPTGFMLKQIKEMRNEFGWSYAAMTYTLWYCKEILEMELVEKYGVALIKTFYNNARNYYAQQEKITAQVNKLSKEQIKTKVINKTQRKSNAANSSLVNLENLLEGGDSH